MPETTMTKATERKILDALTRAVELSTQGETPDGAIAKVATEEKFGPDYVSRMVEGFNVSKELAHRRTAEGDEKAASHDLANAEAVLSIMYPKEPKTEVEKAADEHIPIELERAETVDFNATSAEIPETKYEKYAAIRDPKERELSKKQAKAGVRAEQLYTEWNGAYNKVLSTLNKAAKAVRTPGSVSFDRVESVIAQNFGNIGRTISTAVWQAADGNKWPEIKRADVSIKHGPVPERIEVEVSPYKEILEFKAASEEFGRLTREAGAAIRDYRDAKEAYHSAFFTKAAVLPQIAQTLGTIGAAEVMRGAMSGPKPSPSDIQQHALDLTDPAHEAAMQGIKQQAILTDLLANDPVISTYDPSAVAEAFNELAQLVPKSVEQPLVLRNLLRKRLEQEAFTEHETQQMTQLEEGIQKTEPSVTLPEVPGAAKEMTKSTPSVSGLAELSKGMKEILPAPSPPEPESQGP